MHEYYDVMYIGDTLVVVVCVTVYAYLNYGVVLYSLYNVMDMKASFYNVVHDGQQLHLITCAV